MIPVLLALVREQSDFDPRTLPAPAIDRVFDTGLGPALAYVSRKGPDLSGSPRAGEIQAADLTSRVLTAEIFDALEDAVAAANDVGCQPVLLKGCSTARRYYPEPHLRTMCDLDLLVAPGEFERVEGRLRALGFRQRSAKPVGWFERHHHSMPFWHPARGVWVEVHTRPFPPHYPLAKEPRFSLEALQPMLQPTAVGRGTARVMTDELQLLYTSARWTEIVNTERGVFPILDAALLVHARGAALDWDRVCALAEGSWSATALRVMLGYLDRWDLADVPSPVLRRLAAADRFTSPVLVRLLHRLITAYVIRGRRPGPVLTRRNLRVIWTTLVRPAAPWTKLPALPMNLTFPPDRADRFSLSHALQRIRGVLRPADPPQ